MKKIQLIQLSGAQVAGTTTNDAFQTVADRISKKVRDVVSDELNRLARTGIQPDDGSGFGPTVIAALRAIEARQQ